MAPRVKRIYLPPAPDDGIRVLVDRLWPRGLSKAAAAVDLWAKEVAPSDALRRWFHHQVALWSEFEARYRAELAAPERVAALDQIADLARAGPVTLLYGAKDETHNQARILAAVLAERA
ncbi:MAG: hypothetical protein A4S12_02180 [Proteobacteria bacterium SG_bin5]|nr:DUF488 family protein [Sphingomonas sp.]OQW39684.1 MAG: hypothetical protein A4S12_02180 [Proteobacteria bacterium SG_bin5]